MIVGYQKRGRAKARREARAAIAQMHEKALAERTEQGRMRKQQRIEEAGGK